MGFPKEIKKHLRFVSPVILATSTCNNELNLNGPYNRSSTFQQSIVRIPEEAMHTRKITARHFLNKFSSYLYDDHKAQTQSQKPPKPISNL